MSISPAVTSLQNEALSSLSPPSQSPSERAPSLRLTQNSLMGTLADRIEAIWESHLDLSPYPIPEDLGYVEGTLQGERLVIENHCYQSTHFRKLHLELARVSDRLHILHCVMFPRITYDLPIFGADLVGKMQGISAAIADLSPVRLSPVSGVRSLPPAYEQALSCLPAPTFLNPRALPEWGDIFSQFCVFVAPQDAAEEAQFLQRVESMLIHHCELANATQPLLSATSRNSVQAGHRYYCEKQRQNDKTRRILEMSFGEVWAERYMRTMLFDCVA